MIKGVTIEQINALPIVQAGLLEQWCRQLGYEVGIMIDAKTMIHILHFYEPKNFDISITNPDTNYETWTVEGSSIGTVSRSTLCDVLWEVVKARLEVYTKKSNIQRN